MADDRTINQKLRDCENDPMWADHAEVPKAWCKDAADTIDHLQARVAELTVALSTLVDWDGETWRINSKHPNDREAKSEWAKDIATARAVLSDPTVGVET